MSSPIKKKTGSLKPATRPGWLTRVTGILAFVVIFVAWAQMRREAIGMSLRDATNLGLIAADAMVIVLPYWFLRGRWRWTVLVPVWLVPLFILANMLYNRHFDGFIPFSSFFFTDNFDSRFFACIPQLFRPVDWLYPALPVAFTLWLGVTGRKVAREPGLSWQWKAGSAAATVAMFVWAQWDYTRSVGKVWEENEIPRPVGSILEFRYLSELSPLMSVCYNGLAVHLVRSSLLELFTSRRTIKLNYEQRAGIGQFVEETGMLYKPPAHDFTPNRSKNLVIIVAESLNAWLYGYKVNGEEVMPTLNRLIDREGTIAATGVVTQVCAGGSSDAQLMYNTGLLPLRSKAAVMVYGARHSYPTLVEALSPKEAIEVIAETGRQWNHRDMNGALGYHGLVDRDSLTASGLDPAVMGSDASILELAARKARELPRPFLLTATTLTMHMPFKEDATRRSIPEADLGGVSGSMRNYLLSARYFDRCLADFIASLKRHGVYDNTVIVIVSDHNAATSDAEYQNATESAPAEILFVAVNTGATEKITRPVGQIDVFPTLLDIMGIAAPPHDWRGLGVSMLNPRNSSAIDRNGKLHGTPARGMEQFQRRAWDVSELIIEGDYFGENH